LLILTTTESGLADLSRKALDASDWAEVVTRIRAGDPAATTQLYDVFTRGIRYLLLRTLGMEELEDRLHDCFLIVLEAIRAGELREPARLMGFVQTVVRRYIGGGIRNAVTHRRRSVEFDESVGSVLDRKNDPEKALLARQRGDIARRVFQGLSDRDREVLRRFYLLEQPQEQICEEMGLSYNQFRLLKSRAKARYAKIVHRLTEGRTTGLAEAEAKTCRKALSRLKLAKHI
jgi:RNA polymerase sigma-70 factor (ECF subfamily)